MHDHNQGQAAIEALLIVALGFTLVLGIHQIGRLRSDTLYLLGKSHFLSFLPARIFGNLKLPAAVSTEDVTDVALKSTVEGYATVQLTNPAYGSTQRQLQTQLGFDADFLLQASVRVVPTLVDHPSARGLASQTPLARHSFLLSGDGQSASEGAAQRQVSGSAALWHQSFARSKRLVDNSVLSLQSIDQAWGRAPLTADWLLPWANEVFVAESLGHASDQIKIPTVFQTLDQLFK